MIIILNDDHAYLGWLAHHRDGFVVDARRKPSLKHTVLHRALCPEIRNSSNKRTHWTTGARMKACSLDAGELREWVKDAVGGEPLLCEQCRPGEELEAAAIESLSEPRRSAGLSRQARRVLDHVLEVAVIALEQPAAYTLTLDELAAAEGKQPRQLSAAVLRLLADGYLTTRAKPVPGRPLVGQAALFPTAKALRSLPALADLGDMELDALLHRLTGPPS